MIRIKAKLIEIDTNLNGYSVSKDACIKMIERFKKEGSSIPIRLGASPLTMGRVTELSITENTLFGYIELNAQFVTDGKVLQKLVTSNGTRVLDCEIKEVKFIPGGRK